jgi:hypothetical protein
MSDVQQWYYSDGGRQNGPIDGGSLRQMLSSAQLPGKTLVWRDGLPGWQPAETQEELRPALPRGAAPPPPPPPPVVMPPPPPLAQPVGYANPYQPPRQGDIGQDAGMRMLLPVGRSGWAIASGYLGLFSFFPFIGIATGVAAVITGIVAIRDIKRNPEKHGMGRAIFGSIAGIIFTFAWIVMLVGVLAAQSQQKYPRSRY